MRKYILLASTIFLFTSSTISAQTNVAPKTISAGVVNGKAIELPKPEYPSAAMAIRASGQVKVQVTIDERGNVISASAVSGHTLLRASAEKAARQSKFKPTYLSGQAVKVTGVIIYNFVPSKPSDNPFTDKDNIWTFGLVFSFLQTADDEFIRQIGDENELNSILTDIAKDVPAEFAAEKLLFDKLSKARGNERRVIAGEILSSLKKYLNNEEKWQVEIGEHLGVIVVELLKHIKNLSNDQSQADALILRTNLQKMKTSLLSPPLGISSELIAKFKPIADFADAPDLNSPDTLDLLYKAVQPLFDTFSDEH